MNAKQKLERANVLLEKYGSLLTKKQLSIMNDKYEYDLSLQEIAANHKISRSAALDTINVATYKLEEYEKALGLIKKKEKVLTLIKDKNLYKKINEIL